MYVDEYQYYITSNDLNLSQELVFMPELSKFEGGLQK